MKLLVSQSINNLKAAHDKVFQEIDFFLVTCGLQTSHLKKDQPVSDSLRELARQADEIAEFIYSYLGEYAGITKYNTAGEIRYPSIPPYTHVYNASFTLFLWKEERSFEHLENVAYEISWFAHKIRARYFRNNVCK